MINIMNGFMLRIFVFTLLLLTCAFVGTAQVEQYRTATLGLDNLQAFANPPKNWKMAGGVMNGYRDETLKTIKGTGVLYDDFNKGIQFEEGVNLFTTLEHGDIFLSLDFMVPRGSNSGIYLQGRYEIQLFDSWLVKSPRVTDCGSIYERWDEEKPEGQKGYEGHPPRVNASLAPNVWQHLEIEFQAPRFDSDGRKIQPARFVKVELNGITIHENIFVFGPTRAAAFHDEKPEGPLMIQGDHGPVAFRNIQYALLNDFKASVTDVHYTYFEGRFEDFGDLTKDKEVRSGPAEGIDSKLADDPSALGLVFTGTLNVDASDNYQFTLLRNGISTLEVDGELIADAHERIATKQLSAGSHRLQLKYIKNYSWQPVKLGLQLTKPNSRPVSLHLPASLPNEAPAPLIALNTQDDPEIVRSFMKFGNTKKTHMISVGDPSGVNYAYDLDQAALLKIWRGDFLDVTEMWYERGEPQWAAPLGATISLAGAPVVSFADDDRVLPDTLDYIHDLIYKGYTITSDRLPVYQYQYKNVLVEDAISPSPMRQGLKRVVTLKNMLPSQVIYVRLAEGKSIERVGDNEYAVDNQRFFIQLPTGVKVKTEILKVAQGEALVIRATTSTSIEFSLIW
jgi:hypothetical protein